MSTVARQLRSGYTPIPTSALTTQVDLGPSMRAIEDVRRLPTEPPVLPEVP